jgi:hypothetical protein
MRELNQQEVSRISGGDIGVFTGTMIFISLGVVLVTLEICLTNRAFSLYRSIDFSRLTPEQAYRLGVEHSYLYRSLYFQ